MSTGKLNIDILTLFPDFFDSPVKTSILRLAIEKNLVDVTIRDIRGYARGKYRQVDDIPYGGGPGMVLMLEPLVDCIEHVIEERKSEGREVVLILTCPRGERLKQDFLLNLSSLETDKMSIAIVAGHYEGFDERLYELFDWKLVSIGDFVLSGGEIPALVILDGVARLMEGTLGNPESLSHESFTTSMLDHPVFTRPPEYRGLKVPDVLMSGDHARIESWRAMKRRELTSRHRPDLLHDKE
ncbi:MAG TPA: tRNA (guanosine(37)-N1)-methyltransferase TrmD [bacterium]